MKRGVAVFEVFLKTRINQHHSLATEEKRQMQAVGQRRLIGKGKSNQLRGGGNSLRCFPSPQPLPGEDQREESSLLAVADKTPDPATGFACWEPPETSAAMPLSSSSSTSLPRTASHQSLLAKTHCHSPQPR